MQPIDDVGIAIADVYAKALFKLAREAGGERDLQSELDDLLSYVNATREFERFLTEARVDIETRRDKLEKTMRGRCSDLLLDFLQVLNRKSRLELLEKVVERYHVAFEEFHNQVEITVRSATALSDASRGQLMERLKAYTQSEPVLTELVDPSLIGGMVVHIGDEKIDYSVATSLRRLRNTLETRASHEIHGGHEYFEKV